MSSRVLIGGAVPQRRRRASRYVRRKGYSANRVGYDRRRRLNPDSERTRAYKAILAYDVCSFCGAPRRPGRSQDRDHIVDLLSGGRDSWENLTAACAACNRGRRNTPLLHYLLGRRARAL